MLKAAQRRGSFSTLFDSENAVSSMTQELGRKVTSGSGLSHPAGEGMCVPCDSSLALSHPGNHQGDPEGGRWKEAPSPEADTSPSTPTAKVR